MSPFLVPNCPFEIGATRATVRDVLRDLELVAPDQGAYVFEAR
nr:hypothetical protein [Nannocystis sp.]